jgi:hypothetical protein
MSPLSNTPCWAVERRSNGTVMRLCVSSLGMGESIFNILSDRVASLYFHGRAHNAILASLGQRRHQGAQEESPQVDNPTHGASQTPRHRPQDLRKVDRNPAHLFAGCQSPSAMSFNIHLKWSLFLIIISWQGVYNRPLCGMSSDVTSYL